MVCGTIIQHFIRFIPKRCISTTSAKPVPFKITPNTEFFYTGGNRGAILEALLYAIIHGEGIVKVSGEIGSGKTMLCRMLESMLPDNVEAIYLATPA